MPGLDGVQTTKLIHQLHPEVKIVMLSTFADDDYARRAIGVGAIGYLVKNVAPQEVIGAIRAVRDGVSQISPGVARNLALGQRWPKQESLVLLEPLTPRERQVLHLILKSYENRELARFLNVTEQTARNYVHHLYSKLGVGSRVQLMRLLQENDLGLEDIPATGTASPS